MSRVGALYILLPIYFLIFDVVTAIWLPHEDSNPFKHFVEGLYTGKLLDDHEDVVEVALKRYLDLHVIAEK